MSAASDKILAQVAAAAPAPEVIAGIALPQAVPAPAVDNGAALRILDDVIAAQAAHIEQLQRQLAPQVAPTVLPVKAYFNVVPFCNIYVMRSPGYCEAVSFVAGRLETTDPMVQAHLDTVCDRPGTGVTSRQVTGITAEEKEMHDDLRAQAAEVHRKMVAAGLSTA